MFELLSPAGSMESLKAAVQNGADAVYLGGTFFSARASACNFNSEQLIEAINYAHIRNVKIFVTVNTSIKENELRDFIEYTDFLYKIGVDAIILSDIGVAHTIRKRYPNMELHASTQISAHSLKDVSELERAGFDRVVVARELNVDEIREICEKSSADIEVFIHGALCVSYSGQCLMSSLLGNRSGNRGRCAQPCRQSYKLINISINKQLKNVNGNYLLSPKDLCSVDNINNILKTGVKSLKIEGRMKRAEYVATVTKTYRKVIDNFEKNIETKDIENLKTDLQAIFNRKFTSGYLMKKNGSDIMNTEKPNNIGVKVGEVLGFDAKKNRLKIKLENELSKGDGINLGGGSIGRIIKGNKIYESGFCGDVIEIDFIKEVKKGTEVYKTSDKSLIDSAIKSTKDGVEDKRIVLNCEVYINPCKKIRFVIEGNEIFSNEIIDRANNKKADIKNILEKLSRTKNTPFDFKFIKIDIDENAFVPVSVLNNLRRDAIKIYEDKILNFKNREIKCFEDSFLQYDVDRADCGKLTLKVHKNSQLDEILKDPDKFLKYIKEIYTEDFVLLDKYYYILEKIGIRLIYSAMGVIRNDEYEILKKYLSNLDINIFSKVQISTWGAKNFFRENFSTKLFNVDTYFNIYNSKSINFFVNKFDTNNITISQEINKEEIKDMIFGIDRKLKEKICIDMIVYGHSRSMLTEYCVMGVLTKDCHKDKRCSQCARSDYVLKDEENREFRLFQDVFCRTEIRNHKAIDLRNEINNIFDIGVNRIRFDFTYEDSKTVYKILDEAVDFIEKNKKIKFENEPYFGHFYNSVD